MMRLGLLPSLSRPTTRPKEKEIENKQEKSMLTQTHTEVKPSQPLTSNSSKQKYNSLKRNVHSVFSKCGTPHSIVKTDTHIVRTALALLNTCQLKEAKR